MVPGLTLVDCVQGKLLTILSLLPHLNWLVTIFVTSFLLIVGWFWIFSITWGPFGVGDQTCASHAKHALQCFELSLRSFKYYVYVEQVSSEIKS